ncbi:T9SS type A sorting domain-containing protein, partial [Calditrichota bacterium]
THPEFLIEEEPLEVSVLPEDSNTIAIELVNPGNGPLSWHTDFSWLRADSAEAWELIDSTRLYNELAQDELAAIIFHHDVYFIASRGLNDGRDHPNVIYLFDKDFQQLNTLEQPWSEDYYGYRAMTFGEGLLWGAVRRVIYGMDIYGEVHATFGQRYPLSHSNLSSITYDPVHECLWVASIVSDIFALSTDGEVIDSINAGGYNIYGLYYNPYDPHGFNLYAYSEVSADKYTLLQFNTETGEVQELNTFSTADGHLPDYLTVSHDWDSIQPVVQQLFIDHDMAWLTTTLIPTPLHWLSLNPSAGTVDPRWSLDLELTLTDMVEHLQYYPGKITFYHDAQGFEFELPVTLIVEENSADNDPDATIPDVFTITSIYPNPFNSSTTIKYALPKPDRVSLQIYDVNGRIVGTLFEGRLQGGSHSTAIDGSVLPSGLYFVRIEAGADVLMQKIMLIR